MTWPIPTRSKGLSVFLAEQKILWPAIVSSYSPKTILSPDFSKLVQRMMEYDTIFLFQEADFLTDLDKLYLAMAEVGTELNFNILVYSLGITSVNALKDFKSKDTVILHPDEVNAIKKKLVNTSFKFDQLAQVL